MLTNAVINPICAICQERIGEMTLDLYMDAIGHRGPHLLCPDCRLHKCDCCGYFKPNDAGRKVVDAHGVYLGRACEICWDWVIGDNPTSEDFPFFFQLHSPIWYLGRTCGLSENRTMQTTRSENVTQ